MKLIPTRTIFSEFFGLENLQKEFHKNDTRWLDSTTLIGKRIILSSYIHCNLPIQSYSNFIGRQKELETLQKLIVGSRAPVIIVNGIGGVGKTALVIEIAYLFLEKKYNTPEFNALIFTSAKEAELLATGNVVRLHRQSTLDRIFMEISTILGDNSIGNVTENDQIKKVCKCLSNYKVLLIVDNLDSMTDSDKKKVIYFLRHKLPNNTKAIITTRMQSLDSDITLDCLDVKESKQLIKQQAEEKNVLLTDISIIKIWKRFGGIPLALIYSIGQLAIGYPLNLILEPGDEYETIPNSCTEAIGKFCFDQSLRLIKEQYAYKILLSAAIFRSPPTYEAVINVAGLENEDIRSIELDLDKLYQLSLLQPQNDKRYKMNLMTREYLLVKLNNNTSFASAAYGRWVEWYKNYAGIYGKKDWENFKQKYDCLNSEIENILGVLYWCANNNRYQDVKDLWSYLNDFTNLYNYWKERLYWTSWLIKESRNYDGEEVTRLKATSSKGWTLIQMGEYDKAKNLLLAAWHEAIDTDIDKEYNIRDSLAKHLAYLYIHTKNYDEASNWLKEQSKCIEKMDPEKYEIRIKRSQINNRYYEAQIKFLEKDYGQASILFQDVMEQSKISKWSRRENYARMWLAEIAIKENNLAYAKKLLKAGYSIALNNREMRSIAYYQICQSHLADAKDDKEGAEKWKREANQTLENLYHDKVKDITLYLLLTW